MSDDDIRCTYCGAECYEEEMFDSEKCNQCHVQDCTHKLTTREYVGSNYHRARFQEICLNCECFREIRFYFCVRSTNTGYTATHEDWEHDSINKEDCQ